MQPPTTCFQVLRQGIAGAAQATWLQHPLCTMNVYDGRGPKHACCCRVLDGAAADPDALLRLLEALLSGVGSSGAPTLLGSPQAFAALRSLTLLAGARYVEAVGGAQPHDLVCCALQRTPSLTRHAAAPQHQRLAAHAGKHGSEGNPLQQICQGRPALCAGRPDTRLMRLLLPYMGRLADYAALFQPSPEQLPELLPQLVAAAAAAPDGASAAEGRSSSGDQLKGAASLLRQFPWDATAGVLSDEQVLGLIAPQLIAFAALVGQAALVRGAERDVDDAAEHAMLPLQVTCACPGAL